MSLTFSHPSPAPSLPLDLGQYCRKRERFKFFSFLYNFLFSKYLLQSIPKPPTIEVNKICKICGKEPYVVEKLVAEKSWWHKNCFRFTTFITENYF